MITFRKAVVILFGFFSLSCGVRGNPVPLNPPPELGRGRHTYDKGMDEILKKQKAQEEDEEQKKRKKQ